MTAIDSEAVTTTASRKKMSPKLIPLAIAAVILIGAFAVMSRPTVGTRTSTDTSVSVIIGTADGAESSTFPITLQEGGDPGHEVDHVLTPIKGIDGVANATLDWTSGIKLTVTHDPAVITAEEIEGLLAESGYIPAGTQ